MTDDTMVERMAAEIGRHGWKWAFGEMVGECECGATKFPDTNEPMHAHIATALLPLVHEAQAGAFDTGVNTGIGYASVMAVPGMPEPENPYRTGDDHE